MGANTWSAEKGESSPPQSMTRLIGWTFRSSSPRGNEPGFLQRDLSAHHDLALREFVCEYMNAAVAIPPSFPKAP